MAWDWTALEGQRPSSTDPCHKAVQMKNLRISVERVSTEVEMAERGVGWKWESGSDGTAAVVGMGR